MSSNFKVILIVLKVINIQKCSVPIGVRTYTGLNCRPGLLLCLPQKVVQVSCTGLNGDPTDSGHVAHTEKHLDCESRSSRAIDTDEVHSCLAFK